MILRTAHYTLVGLSALLMSTAVAAEGDEPEDGENLLDGVKVTLDRKGLGVKTEDGAFSINIGARLHFDASLHPGNTPSSFAAGAPTVPTGSADPTDGVEVRRGRIQTKGTLWHDWAWAFAIDFANDGVSVKDLFLAHQGLDHVWLAAGQTKQPYSLQVEMSSNDIPFTERSIDNNLVIPFVDRALGFRADFDFDQFFMGVGVFGDDIDGTATLDEGWGTSGRAVWTPVVEDDMVGYLGFRAAYREPRENAQGIQIRSETTNQSSLYIANTLLPLQPGVTVGGVTGPQGVYSVHDVILFGPEVAFAWGPVWIFGEYNRARVDRRMRQRTLDFQGGHLGAAFTLTGESRASGYKSSQGKFKRLDPKSPFRLSRNGIEGIGAWEFAVQYGALDVSDKDILGGVQGNLSTALNWYLNYNIRLMFNWDRVLHAKSGTVTTATAKNLDVITFRVQFDL